MTQDRFMTQPAETIQKRKKTVVFDESSFAEQKQYSKVESSFDKERLEF